MPSFQQIKRWVIVWGILAILGLIFLAITWNAFFKYVPPGKHLVIIAKNGAPQDEGEVLAGPGQKGIQRDVLGEGWHFITPIVYAIELEENTIIPPGKVGIVTSRGGKQPPGGSILADPGEKGIQRHVLPPGAYRINKHGFDVEEVAATEIKPGFVGVLRRRLGTEAKGRFAAEGTDEQGILKKVLQPGLYYLNTKEFEIIPTEVGIFQTTFHRPTDENAKDTSITFTSKGGFPISVDCTVEWEVLPEDMPSLVAEYGTPREIEQKVIDVQAHAIGRDKGIDYSVQDFLEGRTREKFQEDFTKELTNVCKAKNVTVHSAFIRRIDIPEEYLQQIRDKQIAAETELTNKAKELAAQSEIEVKRQRETIDQEVAKVMAETRFQVTQIEQDVQNVTTRTEAEIEKLKAEYAARVAIIDSQRKKVVGEAEAKVTKLRTTAANSIHQLKMEAFQNDPNAYLRYTLAQQLSPTIVLRLFHSGAGTFWTNLDNKNLNFMMPIPAPAEGAKTATGNPRNGFSDGNGAGVGSEK